MRTPTCCTPARWEQMHPAPAKQRWRTSPLVLQGRTVRSLRAAGAFLSTAFCRSCCRCWCSRRQRAAVLLRIHLDQCCCMTSGCTPGSCEQTLHACWTCRQHLRSSPGMAGALRYALIAREPSVHGVEETISLCGPTGLYLAIGTSRRHHCRRRRRRHGFCARAQSRRHVKFSRCQGSQASAEALLRWNPLSAAEFHRGGC